MYITKLLFSVANLPWMCYALGKSILKNIAINYGLS